MTYLTLSMEGVPTDKQRHALEEAARRGGGHAIWRSSAAAGRSYASIALPNPEAGASIATPAGTTLYEKAVIALAVFPASAEALPPLLDAFAGDGRPAGILACRAIPNGVVVEWDPSATGACLVTSLIDAELGRFACGRTSELLSPLPPEVITAIAAEGLQAEQIVPERVLELQIGSDRV
ncbi:MAG TPA: hypothetical protein VHR97_06080 [Candidatus Baltobacteraceae bacterium]|nr:hypothetical protein [Candidatus Baltobacteraceae bacterium]